MPVPVSIASERDAAAVSALFRAVDLHYRGSASPVEAYAPVAARALAPVGDCELALAYVDGEAVGFASFAVVYPGPPLHGMLYMKELFVLAAFRGLGIGNELVRFLAGIAVARGCPRMDWTVERDSPRAMSFYERLGARPREEKVYYRLDGDALGDLAGSGPVAT